MGKSFNILVWDSYGCGLNLIQKTKNKKTEKRGKERRNRGISGRQ